ELLRTAHIVFEVGVAAVNDDVAGLETLGQRVDGLLCGIAGRDHDPRRPRLRQLGREVIERRRSCCTFFRQSGDVLRPQVGEYALVAPSRPSPARFGGLKSEPPHWCPPRTNRRTMLLPIRPRPIIPSCIESSTSPAPLSHPCPDAPAEHDDCAPLGPENRRVLAPLLLHRMYIFVPVPAGPQHHHT